MAASRVTVYFPCPVERVWQTVTDLMNTAWRGDLARVEILNETHFVEHTKSGYATNFTASRFAAGPSPWKTAACPGPGWGSLRRRRAAPG